MLIDKAYNYIKYSLNITKPCRKYYGGLINRLGI